MLAVDHDNAAGARAEAVRASEGAAAMVVDESTGIIESRLSRIEDRISTLEDRGSSLEDGNASGPSPPPPPPAPPPTKSVQKPRLYSEQFSSFQGKRLRKLSDAQTSEITGLARSGVSWLGFISEFQREHNVQVNWNQNKAGTFHLAAKWLPPRQDRFAANDKAIYSAYAKIQAELAPSSAPPPVQVTQNFNAPVTAHAISGNVSGNVAVAVDDSSAWHGLEQAAQQQAEESVAVRCLLTPLLSPFLSS